MQKDIQSCVEVLLGGGIILYPTDTVWALGCDATNEEAVSRLWELKQGNSKGKMVCLVANDFMLEQHVQQVPELAYDIMDVATKPITIVYDQALGMAKNLVQEDHTIAIRVATDKFCQYLISKFKKPIVATTATIDGNATPRNLKEISPAILKGVDYVVSLHHEKNSGILSSIIQLKSNGTVKIIRE